MKKLLLAAAIMATVGALPTARPATADVIVFNLPSGVPFLGNSYSQDGFTFTNSYPDYYAYGNWIAIGEPGFNPYTSADIFQNYASTTNTITADNGIPFSFQSIGLANVYNNGGGGDVQFTFNYAGGGSSVETVTLGSGVYGLQDFTFNQTDLSSVVFQPTTTEGPWIQFDLVGVNGTTVPEPASMALLGIGLAGLGAIRRRTDA